MSKPVFSTERFDVFHVECERNPALGSPRDVYLAFSRIDDIPRPVCTVTIFPCTSYVEWIETIEEFRREKVATEVLRGLEKHIGEVVLDGVTPAGIAFCDAYCAEEEAAP